MRKYIFRFVCLISLFAAVFVIFSCAVLFQSRFDEQIREGFRNSHISIVNQDGEIEFANAANSSHDRDAIYAEMWCGKTYTHELRLTDEQILKIVFTTDSVYTILYDLAETLVLMLTLLLFVSFMLSKRVVKKIIAPINRIDLDSDLGHLDSYDEIAPFIGKLMRQRTEINEKISDLNNRADTIDVITKNMKEGLILVDKNGIVLTANYSATKIFNERDMISQNILYSCRSVKLLQKIKYCLSGKNTELYFSQNKRQYIVYLNPVRDENEISGAILLFLDVSDKYMAEKQRREFSANVSHELKTPLTSISVLSEMLENNMVKPEDTKDVAANISRQTKRLIDIVENIIKLSEFDEGELEKENTRFDLSELAKDLITELSDKADEKNISIKLEAESFYVIGNNRMIDELLYNLLDNAIKYNKENGTVTISLSTEGNGYKITVSDTGIGIPKKYQARVFERFYRVDKSRTKKIGGTGLGLSIVKHIILYHEGRSELESKENMGTRITCFLKNKSI